MSSSPEPAYANGHASPTIQSTNKIELDDRASISDLSDANDAPLVARHVATSPTPSSGHEDSIHDLDAHADDIADESTDEDLNASDDGDFDAEDDAAGSQSDVPRDAGSSSSSSHRAAKRKAELAEDEHMRENPELYGLRRSVCCQAFASCCSRTC